MDFTVTMSATLAGRTSARTYVGTGVGVPDGHQLDLAMELVSPPEAGTPQQVIATADQVYVRTDQAVPATWTASPRRDPGSTSVSRDPSTVDVGFLDPATYLPTADSDYARTVYGSGEPFDFSCETAITGPGSCEHLGLDFGAFEDFEEGFADVTVTLDDDGRPAEIKADIQGSETGRTRTARVRATMKLH
ncbi:hypothetical protein, partial [Actinoplanes rectilineatus]|uniref:hypothetical protein n=1 Tax=Actinoplanes rectilineatus TaxID=113571 RepID=UPI0005F2FC63